MSDNNINKMDFKQLRNEVQLLRDELAIMKRKYEDILYNLDTDNFSASIVKQGKNMSTKIEQNAESITLQAEKIDETKESVANLSVKADEISSMVTTNISAFFESDEFPTKNNTNNEQRAILCLFENVYYYYDDIEEKWKKYPENGLTTMFVQTGEGFDITGNVRVSGDVVSGGTIKGARFSDAGGSGYLYLNTNESVADLVLCQGDDFETFKLFDDITGVSLFGYGNRFLSVGSSRTSPQGNWNFAGCTITDWGDNAPTAVFA